MLHTHHAHEIGSMSKYRLSEKIISSIHSEIHQYSDEKKKKKYLEEYSGPELKWLKELVEKALNSSIYSEEQKKKLKLLRVAILLSY